MSDDVLTRRHPDRREFVSIGVGVFVALSLPAAVIRRHVSLVKRGFPVMGTLAEIQVAHSDERFAEDAIDAAIAELQRVERTMTRFKSDSDIGRANLGASRDGIRVTGETATVIAAALRAASVSEGRFDPAVGEVSELWDVLNRHDPPPADQVQRLAKRGFWRKVDLSTSSKASWVRFEDRDLHLDLGAIAKGHGIDRATQVLRARGVKHAIVTVGGDLFALGNSPEGEPWTVGIRSPHDLRALASTLTVSDRAVATSGDYERFFRYRGVRYHHLMDPETAAPRRTQFHSATVIADHCIDADAASTSVFGLPHDAALRIARRLDSSADAIPLT
ncbi:MAG TPA: FAD:protein FMN transferase [Gemmatimonadaceae bacterium]|nr:FAD:protein FMN transferase [Gemmatimonadaceae bacterium]